MTAITAWRYWWVSPPVDKTYVFGDVDCYLRGDIEVWDGPFKGAGHHDPRGFSFARAWLSTNIDPRLNVRHPSPLVGCLCGVNAVKRLRSADLEERIAHAEGQPLILSPFMPVATQRRPLEGWGVAVAQVELGGVVDEYDEGYRAAQAQIAGPIYVVIPPQDSGGLDWQSVLERRYGQPVLRQSPGEALEWIRKDEQAHGHRQAHQDPRTGTAGSPCSQHAHVTATGALAFSPVARQGSITAIGARPGGTDPFKAAFDRTLQTFNDTLALARAERARREARARTRARLNKAALVAVRAVRWAAEVAGFSLAVGWWLDVVNFRVLP